MEIQWLSINLDPKVEEDSEDILLHLLKNVEYEISRIDGCNNYIYEW